MWLFRLSSFDTGERRSHRRKLKRLYRVYTYVDKIVASTYFIAWRSL